MTGAVNSREDQAPHGGTPHPRSVVGRIAVTAGIVIACGLATAALLLAGARWRMPASLTGPVADCCWTGRSRAWFVPTGFYPAELDGGQVRSFSWTGRTAQLAIPLLDPSHVYRLTLTISAGRPPQIPAPQLFIDAAGMRTAVQTSKDAQVVSIDLPRRRAAGAVVTMDLSGTMVPGPQDPRELGMIVTSVGLTPGPGGHFRPIFSVTFIAALAVMACIAGVLLCGLPLRLAVPASACMMVALTWLMLQDGAFIGLYAYSLLRIGIGVLLVGAAVALVRLRHAARATPGWAVAVAVVLAASALKLAAFAHPLATIGDAMFQVHRAALVHAGTYYFTSITPAPSFEFPYPVALYVCALPFWRFFPTQPDLVLLLRIVTLAADAAVGVALYAAARGQWNDTRAAWLCALLWSVATAPLQALSNANLTNAFGQAVFGVAMGTLAWNASRERTSWTGLFASGVLLVVAFVSHFGTLCVGLAVLVAVAVLLGVGGGTRLRRFGIWVFVVTLAAGAVSYAVYYSHFNSVYAATLARIEASRATDATSPSKIVASPALKIRRWIDQTADDYGRPGVMLALMAAAGLFLLARRRPREAFTRVLGAWALVWAAVTIAEFLAPIEMRASLAAAPVFACLAAYAVARLSAHSRAGAWLAVIVTLVIGWDAVRIWMQMVGAFSPWS